MNIFHGVFYWVVIPCIFLHFNSFTILSPNLLKIEEMSNEEKGKKKGEEEERGT